MRGTKPFATSTTMRDSKDWPETITTLVAADICKGSFVKGERRCLMCWAGSSFKGYSQKNLHKFNKTIIKNAIASGSKYTIGPSVIGHNDHGGLTHAQLAEVWNQSLRDHGYDA